MANNDLQEAGDVHLRVRRGRVDSVTLYEVTDSELETLERGSPGSLQLNFAFALIPTGLSFLTALLTSQVSDRVYLLFVVLTVACLLVGVILLAQWGRSRKSTTNVLRKIKERIPEQILEVEQSSAQSTRLPPRLPPSSSSANQSD